MFKLTGIHLENFRCFAKLDMAIEEDLTAIFAENGGGKSALLTALAMGLAVAQPRSPKELKLDPLRDIRKAAVGVDESDFELVTVRSGPCKMSWSAAIGPDSAVDWSIEARVGSGRRPKLEASKLHDAIEAARQPGERWPLIAWYGTDRMARGPRQPKPPLETHDRWDGYLASLNPAITDAAMLAWLRAEVLGDLVRRRREEPERRFDEAMLAAMTRATPGVAEIWYDPVEDSPMVRLAGGHLASWAELSDGFHVFIALVGDIARRALMLNALDGADAPLLIEGVVLIDEIDLHLHPRWQRIVLDGLRAAFPKLQFIVTTHSPQVLSSARNRQVRRLSNWELQTRGVLVEGRDSNAILRDLMGTSERDDEGRRLLTELYDAIDGVSIELAQAKLDALRRLWGSQDPEVIRAEGMLDEERDSREESVREGQS